MKLDENGETHGVKIRMVGGSFVITIPRYFMELLNLGDQDYLKISRIPDTSKLEMERISTEDLREIRYELRNKKNEMSPSELDEMVQFLSNNPDMPASQFLSKFEDRLRK